MAEEESIKEELPITDHGEEYLERTSMAILPDVRGADGSSCGMDEKNDEASEIHGIDKFLEVQIKQEPRDDASPTDPQDRDAIDDPLSSPVPRSPRPPSPMPDAMPAFQTVKVETLSPIPVPLDEAMEEEGEEDVAPESADVVVAEVTQTDPLAHATDGSHPPPPTAPSENKRANPEVENDKFFKCDICGEDFKHSMELRTHLTTHNPERSIKCELCSYSCRFKSDLTRHMPTHLRLKPFKCGECGKEFKRAGALTQHLTCHSTEVRFYCDQCDYTCRFKSNLVQHTLMHTGLKEFRCTQCGKLFTRSGDLSRHLLIHSAERNAACNVCEKRFKRRSDLVQHLLIHTSVKLFKCEECGSEFKKASYLARHVKRHKTEIRGDVSSLCHTELSL